MKIDEKKTLGFIIEKNKKLKKFVKNHFDFMNNNFKFNYDRNKYFEEIFIKNKTERFYVTKTALNIIAKINLDKLDNKLLFNKLTNNLSYKFIISDFAFFIITNIKKSGVVDIHFYEYVIIDGSKRQIGGFNFMYDYNNDFMYTSPTKNVNEEDDLVITNNAFTLLQALIAYYCYSDVEFKYIKAKEKIGTRKNGHKNNTSYDFTIIDSIWNTIVIRNKGFKVRGHLRLQPCGVKSNDRKLIWVTEHKKNGYIRGLKR